MDGLNPFRKKLITISILVLLVFILGNWVASASTENISSGLNEEFRSVMLVDSDTKYLCITKTQENINGSNQNVFKVMIRNATDGAPWSELYRAFGSNSDIRSIQRIPGTQKYFMVEQRRLSVVDGLTESDFNNRTSLLGGSVPANISVNIEGGLAVGEDEFFVTVNNGVHWKKGADDFINISGNLNTLAGSVNARTLFYHDNALYVNIHQRGLFKLDLPISGAPYNWSPVGDHSTSNNSKFEIRSIYIDNHVQLFGAKNGVYMLNAGTWQQVLTLNDNQVEGFLAKDSTIYAYTQKTGMYSSSISNVGFTQMWTAPATPSIHIRSAVWHNGNIIAGVGHSNGGALYKIAPQAGIPQVVDAPTANPAAGQVESGTLVTLTTSTSGATIYYTLDGSMPTISSTQYTSPIEISGPTTIKAMAAKDGMDNSAVLTAQYTITPGAPPGIPPHTGVFEGIGKGRNDGIKAVVTLVNNVIESIVITENHETPYFWAMASPVMENRIITEQKVDVDGVSGATQSSNGIKLAVYNALKDTAFINKGEAGAWIQLLSGMEGTHVLTINQAVFISRNNKQSTVYLRDSNGNWNSILSNVPEIDAVHRGSTGRIYLMGLKEGVSFHTSDNQGMSWASPANGLTAVPNGKIESIYEVSADELYIVVEKKGIYKSIDGGLNWQAANGNLPMEPGKNDYDARTLNRFGGKWYSGTKKQGVLTSTNMIDWETLKNNQGLTHNDSKDVRDVAVINGNVYIATKLGVWKTSLEGDDPWVQVTGYNGDVRKLLVQNVGENERLYALAHKDQNILYLSQGKLHPFTNKTGSIITDDFRDMTYDSTIGASGGFLVAHKAGLLSIEDDYRAGESQPETPKSMHADGRYRGTYEDGGYQQVSIEFDLKQDIIENVSWRHLFYKNVDYRTIQEGHNQYPVKQQLDQVLQYLKGKHISIIKDPDNVFLKPGDFITNIDGFSGATIRGTKISSAMRDGLNRGIYHPRGNEIIREIGEYDNGVYRGTFNDGGYQQVSIQFRLENNVISNLSYRHLYYKDVDYRNIQAGHAQHPVKQQYDQILAYLNNKPLETIFDLHNPGSFIGDIDGFSGATVRANKVLSAIRDALNREVYNPLSSGGMVNPKAFRAYEDGVYRGTYGDDGVQQVSIQFSLKDNIVSNLSYRWLYYKGNDYLKMQAGDNLYPVVIQYQQMLAYLHGKPLEALYDLHNNKGIVMENIDGFSGATVRSNKVFSAMMDGLNRGVYGKDTRPFSISGKIDRDAGIKANATVARTSAPNNVGNEVVVFQLMKNGTEPVSIAAIEKDISSTESLIAHFNVTGQEYSVKVFVFDSFTSDTSTALTSLAAPRTLN